MKPSTFLHTVLGVALLATLSACSKGDAPPASANSPSATAPAGSSYDAVAATGKGFTVGALMSAQTVYVMFDPQCPHCGHLWQASLPLHNQVKFTWVPVAFNKDKSLPQAVALLSSADPLADMTAHEASLLAGNGGISASSSMPPELEKAVMTNTQLLNSLGVDSVPFLVAKNRKTGALVSNMGAMETAQLAKLIGLD